MNIEKVIVPIAAMAVSAGIQAEAQQPARHITKIIVHCSATPEGRDVQPEEIRRWHLARGFADIGYHFVVTLDGTVHTGRPIGMTGAHCLGQNTVSVGVCYVGGCDSRMRPKDTRTPAQRKALRQLVAQLKEMFPEATVHGHREFAAKACPSFDIRDL